MEIGLGVDPGAGLTFPQHRDLARAAANLGYSDLWTPAGVGNDAFQTCAQWWSASADAPTGGLTTGIAVVPVPIWSAPALATAAATLGELTGGRFILGIGAGSIYSAAYRQSLGLPNWKPLPLMRDFLITLRGLLAGEKVEYSGTAVELHGVGLGRRPGTPAVPVYLGALGPGMVRLAGGTRRWRGPQLVYPGTDRLEPRAGRRRGGARRARCGRCARGRIHTHLCR